MSRDLVVTLEADTTRFVAEMQKAIESAARLAAAIAPSVTRFRLWTQRDRIRLVTRRKQRRSW